MFASLQEQHDELRSGKAGGPSAGAELTEAAVAPVVVAPAAVTSQAAQGAGATGVSRQRFLRPVREQGDQSGSRSGSPHQCPLRTSSTDRGVAMEGVGQMG
eukprot:12536896-Alexandrium_andersonii.AAC.1